MSQALVYIPCVRCIEVLKIEHEKTDNDEILQWQTIQKLKFREKGDAQITYRLQWYYDPLGKL